MMVIYDDNDENSIHEFFFKRNLAFEKIIRETFKNVIFFASCKQTAATYLHYLGWSHVCVNDSLSLILFLKNIIFVQY